MCWVSRSLVLVYIAHQPAFDIGLLGSLMYRDEQVGCGDICMEIYMAWDSGSAAGGTGPEAREDEIIREGLSKALGLRLC